METTCVAHSWIKFWILLCCWRCCSKNGSALNRVHFHSYIKTFLFAPKRRARARARTHAGRTHAQQWWQQRAYLCTCAYGYMTRAHRCDHTYIHTPPTSVYTHKLIFFATVFTYQSHSLRCRSFSQASAAV